MFSFLVAGAMLLASLLGSVAIEGSPTRERLPGKTSRPARGPDLSDDIAAQRAT